MRLLIVEDETELAALLRRALTRSGFAVDLAPAAADAQDCLAVVQYDCIILDLGLPDSDGLSVLRSLRRAGSAVPVLILTARDAPEDRVIGLDEGADDYLIKPFHLDELVSRIRALLRRPNAALGRRLCLGNVSLDTVSRETTVGRDPLALSLRETALLEALLRRQGNVITREFLEQTLYDFETAIGSNALEVLIHRLRRKLTDSGADIAVHTLRGVGYLASQAEPKPY